jgi:hypothetical protein
MITKDPKTHNYISSASDIVNERTVMKSDTKVYHYIGLSDETTIRLRRHILDTFKTSKMLSETIERYIIEGLANDATPSGQAELTELVRDYEEAKRLVAAKRVLSVRQTAATHRKNRKGVR